MKRTIMVLAAALWVAGIGAAAAQTESDTLRRERIGAEGTTQGGSQRLQAPPERSDEFRDAAGAPMQRQDLRRPPADAAPGAAASLPPDQTGRQAGGGAAGLTIGAIFLALIVFILYRRGRRLEP